MIGKTECGGGVRSNILRLHLDLVVKQLCYNATFRDQKVLCCGNVFLHKKDETKNSSGLQFKACHKNGMFSVQGKLDLFKSGGVGVGGGGGTESNPKITILEILVYKMQLEIIKSKIFTRFNFIAKLCSQEISMSKFPEWLFSDQSFYYTI